MVRHRLKFDRVKVKKTLSVSQGRKGSRMNHLCLFLGGGNVTNTGTELEDKKIGKGSTISRWLSWRSFRLNVLFGVLGGGEEGVV